MTLRQCKICEQTSATTELRQGTCGRCRGDLCVLCDEPLTKWQKQLGRRVCDFCHGDGDVPEDVPPAS
jgi:hypothetical protein